MPKTINELSQWALDTLPSAYFEEVEGELVIYTGLREVAGGLLHPTKEEEV